MIATGDDNVVDLTDSPPPAKKPRLIAGRAVAPEKTKLEEKARSSSYFSTGDPDDTGKTGKQPIASRGLSVTPFTTPLPTTSLKEYRLPKLARVASAQSGSAFDTYCISVKQSESDDRSIPAETSTAKRSAAQTRKHEEWQRRVNAPGGVVPRRRSLALDEAAAAEARKAVAGSDADGEEDATPIVEDASDDETKKVAEGVASKLAAKYAAKGAETMGKAKGRAKKKEEEIGPSGQTYTPLEKQFMEIKKENQDVLLLMEVGYKYKFHGEDAKIASRELGIAA